MPFTLDKDSPTMSLDIEGARCAVHIGKESFLMHCTRNVNLASVDSVDGKNRERGNAVKLAASVLLAGDPNAAENKFEAFKWGLGLIQVARVITYEVGYAGKNDSQGSVFINIRPGFDPNPSIDGESNNMDDIFNAFAVNQKTVLSPKKGVLLSVTDGDNPSSMFDLALTNRVSGARNFVYCARRREDFVSYLIARDPRGGVHYVSRIGWHIGWDVEFQWKDADTKPTVRTRSSIFEKGGLVLGPPSVDDPHGKMALSPSGTSTNDLDTAATQAALNNRDARYVTQLTTRPSGLPSPFFN